MRKYLLFAGLLLGCGDKDSTEDSASEMDPTTGVSYGNGMGTGVSQGGLFWEGSLYTDGQIFFSGLRNGIENGTDCDDTDTASFTTADDPDCDGVLN